MQKEKDENVMRLLKKLNLAMESIGNAMMVKHGQFCNFFSADSSSKLSA